MKFINQLSFLFFVFSFSSLSYAEQLHCFQADGHNSIGLRPQFCVQSIQIVGNQKMIQSIQVTGPDLSLLFSDVIKPAYSDYAMATTRFSKSKKANITFAMIPEFDMKLNQWTQGDWKKIRVEASFNSDGSACFVGAGCTSTLTYTQVAP